MPTVPSPSSSSQAVQDILAQAFARGVTLQVQAGRLRYRPKSAMTPALAKAIQAHRAGVMACIGDGLSDTTSEANHQTAHKSVKLGVLSVVSVSEPPATCALWSEAELAIIAKDVPGGTLASLPLAAAVKETFAGWGVTLVAIDPVDTPTLPPACSSRVVMRWQAARLMRQTSSRANWQARAMRDAWHERLAICIVDGGMSEESASPIALDELEEMLNFWETQGVSCPA